MKRNKCGASTSRHSTIGSKNRPDVQKSKGFERRVVGFKLPSETLKREPTDSSPVEAKIVNRWCQHNQNVQYLLGRSIRLSEGDDGAGACPEEVGLWSET